MLQNYFQKLKLFQEYVGSMSTAQSLTSIKNVREFFFQGFSKLPIRSSGTVWEMCSHKILKT